jgi:parallel beta-helix repeat protein
MRIRAIAVLMAASLWGQLCAQSDWATVAQRAKSSVVKIIVRTADGEGTGTGFAVSADGKIATNYHVIESASKIFVKLPNGRTVGIERVVAFDKRVDLAILQVEGVSLPPLSLDDGEAVVVGQEVCVMGSPLGLEQSFSTGVVSAKRVMDGFEWIQITAPISPGNSGSPVMTRSGKVIGVATFTTREGQNLNFASSVKYLRMLLSRQPIRPERPSAQPPQEPPAPQEPPSSMLVTNASEFVQAISEIKEGGEITLQPGEYRLREPLHIRKSLTISGTGYEETVIVFEGKSIFAEDEGKCGGIKFSGEGMLSIRDVSIRYSGADEGCDVITAVKGDLRLTRCFVSGGIGRDEQKNTIGCGIWIHGTAQAVISGCIVADNEVGIRVGGFAKARIELCEMFSNELAGAVIMGNASCEVRHCEIKDNRFGVSAAGIARLVARNNTCEGNTYNGIELLGSARGEIEGNTCRNNGLRGIAAHDQSRLVARNNTCEGNTYNGIALLGSAQGEVERNTCRNNGLCGIAAHDQSRLVARNNTCEGNQGVGIALFGSAQGEIEVNTCRNNGLCGIAAHDQSRLVARNNTCEGNQGVGIALFGSAQGEIEVNTCRNNGSCGIWAQDQSRLVARNNTCEGNEMGGIALFGSVQGEIEGNQCANNKLNGIYIHERSVKATLRNNTVYGNRGGDIYDPRR